MVNSPLRKRNDGIAGGGEAEQRVGPVMDAQDAFLVEIAHRCRSLIVQADCGGSNHLYTIHSYTNE